MPRKRSRQPWQVVFDVVVFMAAAFAFLFALSVVIEALRAS